MTDQQDKYKDIWTPLYPHYIPSIKAKINISLSHPDAKIPERAHNDDAGADLFTPIAFSLLPNQKEKINVGVHFEIQDGYFGLVQAKSGLASKYSINTIGNIIDAAYRGPVHVMLINHGSETVHFSVGDKIAQLIIMPCLLADFNLVDSLSDTVRGEGGFGSTGSR